jgi:hypothetical protein
MGEALRYVKVVPRLDVPSLNYRVCVGYLGRKLDWIPRSPVLRGNEESSPGKRRTPRSSRRAAGGCGATGGPRCHGWQRGPGTQPLVLQGLAGPRKARCHVATHFKAGNEGPTDQDRQRQSNTVAQAASESAAQARRGRATSFPRGAGERGLPKEKTHTHISMSFPATITQVTRRRIRHAVPPKSRGQPIKKQEPHVAARYQRAATFS